MTGDEPLRLDPAVRKQLHDAAGELSLAVMQLGLVLEDARLDPALRESLAETLDACRAAADAIREAWRLGDDR